MTDLDKRLIIRVISTLRDQEDSFSVKRLKVQAGIDKAISESTVERLLKREGYKYLQSQKKDLCRGKDVN